MSLALLVMFIAYVLQVRYKPFMSEAEMEEEKRNLQVMSMADAAKIFPPADVARALKVTAAVAAEKRAVRHTVHLGAMSDTRELRRAFCTRLYEYFHDFNTVEGML
jgi:hypothetical protein